MPPQFHLFHLEQYRNYSLPRDIPLNGRRNKETHWLLLNNCREIAFEVKAVERAGGRTGGGEKGVVPCRARSGNLDAGKPPVRRPPEGSEPPDFCALELKGDSS
jgi:hypothetical protein